MDKAADLLCVAAITAQSSHVVLSSCPSVVATTGAVSLPLAHGYCVWLCLHGTDAPAKMPIFSGFGVPWALRFKARAHVTACVDSLLTVSARLRRWAESARCCMLHRASARLLTSPTQVWRFTLIPSSRRVNSGAVFSVSLYCLASLFKALSADSHTLVRPDPVWIVKTTPCVH